jgi:outer membrane protein, heavy metal efflux system
MSGAGIAAQERLLPRNLVRPTSPDVHASHAQSNVEMPPSAASADTPPDPRPLESLSQPSLAQDSPSRMDQDRRSSDPLTISDATQIALGNHPALARASARVMAARGAWLQAGLLPNPTAGYASDEMGDEGTAGMQGGFVGQEIVTAGKLRLSRAVAAQDIRRAEAELEAMRLRVVSDVQAAFYDALIAQHSVRQVTDLLRISNDAVTTTDVLLKQGELSRVELLQARIEANTTEILLETRRNAEAAARRRLEALLGVEPLAELSGDPQANLPDYDWDAALGRLLAESPELAAATALVDRAGWAVDRARAERVPNVSAQVSVQHNNATAEDVASVQIGLPLPIFDRNQGGIREARSELAAAHSNVVRLERDIKWRFAATYERFANARRRAAEYQRRILPDAKESLDLVNVLYRNGEAGYLTLLTTQRTYVETHLSFLEALRDLRKAAAEIDGMLLEGSLEDR